MVEVAVDDCKNSSEAFNFVATGIANPVSFSDITVYPNPVADKLRIRNDAGRKLSIRLTDMFGRIVFEKTIQDLHEEISTSSFSPGNYILIITDLNKKQTVSRKLIKI